MFSTTSESSISVLLRWLDAAGAIGLEQLCLKMSSGAVGLGCFALRDIVCGETLFVIPQECILGFQQVFRSNISTFIRSSVAAMKLSSYDGELVSEELLYWLYMIQQRHVHSSSSSSKFNTYLRSLGSKQILFHQWVLTYLCIYFLVDSLSPSLLGWTDTVEETILETLGGTNLAFSLQQSLDKLRRQANLLDAIRAAHPDEGAAVIPQQHFNLESLLWARGHYLARRYPAKFSLPVGDEEDGHVIEGSAVEAPCGLCREAGLESRGCLVPLLDILNHNHDREWLTFKVEGGCLHVICNYPLTKVGNTNTIYWSLCPVCTRFDYVCM